MADVKRMYEIEESTYGVWIKFPNGRSRFALKGGDLYAQLMEGHSNPELRERGRDITTYYRDFKTGEIGVPPSADSPIPAGCERLEARSIFEQDKLAKSLADQERIKWEGSREATEAMESGMGSPRQVLIDKMATGHYKSQLEKDLIPMLIQDLDREEQDRGRHEHTFSVHAREFDSKRR